MVVTPPKSERHGRRAWLGIALRNARCGLITGGDHAWGERRCEYEGARWRKQTCRWCRATRTPAEEIDRNPLTAEELQRGRECLAVRPPTDDEMERALKRAEEAGIYRNGRFVWQ